VSELSRDDARRILERMHGPPSRWAAVAAAWDAGFGVEYRYESLGDDPVNPWTSVGPRSGYDHRLGGAWTMTPNWWSPELEWRVAPGQAELPL
jgi:hypothetical protein